MFKSLRKLGLLKTEADAGGQTEAANEEAAQNLHLVERIIAGDSAAETELWTRFKGGIFQIVLNNVRDYHLAEDLSQETYVIILEKIRNGDVRQPEKLRAFVSQVARFHTIEQIRIFKRKHLEDLGAAEHVSDPNPNQLNRLETAEELQEIRGLIQNLIPRDRELITRLYINEEPKDSICADLGLTSTQFDRIVHRARQRYRALYLKHRRRTLPEGHR